MSQEVMRLYLKVKIPASRGQGHGLLAEPNGLIWIADQEKMET